MQLLWRIYYDDGETYDNLNGAWEAAPPHGVIAVVVRDPTETWGRWVYSGYAPDRPCEHCDRFPSNEFYVKAPGSDEPYATWDLRPFLDLLGLSREEAEKQGLIKFGRVCPQKRWAEIMRAACADPDFPVGSPRRRSSDFR